MVLKFLPSVLPIVTQKIPFSLVGKESGFSRHNESRIMSANCCLQREEVLPFLAFTVRWGLVVERERERERKKERER